MLGDTAGGWQGLIFLHLHDLRHISATDLIILKGIPEREVMGIAGWKSNMLGTYFSMNSRRAAQSVIDRDRAALRQAN